ncbi:MAG: YggT family protein [Tistrella sp.]|jgi:YggT family protein|uniref:YggT family protein n=1 Tax=Tistrella mobilis TaxID=171437 RepID=A0A162LM45_9PROT|nr:MULTISPECIES: YggT family protein [Tistrella]KYO55669.1 hypothetical protein AUP44_23060 [Tistrella mobilis]MAD40641.1 YggT family protein [Tistrella sp.]MBA78884.1 YggT family protein [Tistrella sp.]HAE48290.1 YggT family protein [Tistrella mobilis]|tara:strand:+ start:1039 stop:1356 length:318 start_codon:yes stop_codon:yes gene_type:complete
MQFDPFFWTYWAYNLPNYVLSLLIYTLIGRALLSAFIRPGDPNYIWRFFCRITDPVLRLTAPLTPRFVLPGLRPLVAAGYLWILRIIFWLVMYNLGLAPRLNAPA